jgi:lipid A disaccharide synthetase
MEDLSVMGLAEVLPRLHLKRRIRKPRRRWPSRPDR